MRIFRVFTRIYPILIILVILLLYFNKLVFQNQIYVTGDFLRSDILSHNLPVKYLLYESWKSFTFPFWTDLLYLGYPLFADGHPGIFYPPNLILFKILPFITAFNWSVIINFFIASLGTYFLARSFKISTLSSLFVSLAFSLSSFFTLHIVHHSILNSSSWLPFYFLFLKKLFETKDIKYLLLSSLILAMMILGGFPQIVLYSTFMAFIFFLYLSFKERKILWFLGSYLGVIIIGFLLASVQLLPTLELISQSTRNQGLGNIALDSLPFHPRNLITFVSPYAFGDPGQGTYPHFGGDWGMFWENTGYMGILALIFAFSTLVLIKKNRFVAGLWVMAAISILLALGKYGPLSWVFYFPGFNFFRVTGRFLLTTIFALTLLSGFGLDYLASKFKEQTLKIGLLLSAILILVIDLFGFSFKYNPTAKASNFLSPPPILESIKLNPGERVFSIGSGLVYDEINKNGWRNNLEANINHKNALAPDINLLWGLPTLEGYSGLYLQNHENFKNKLYEGLTLKENNLVEISPAAISLLKLSSTRYLISAFDLQGEDLKEVGAFGDGKQYKLYELKNISPFGILSEGEVKLISQTPASLEFQINSSKEQEFLAQSNYYPGWKAFVNNRESPISKAQDVFKSVTVPQGESTVKFVYKPNSFYLGLAISGLSLFGVLLTFFLKISQRLFSLKMKQSFFSLKIRPYSGKMPS